VCRGGYRNRPPRKSRGGGIRLPARANNCATWETEKVRKSRETFAPSATESRQPRHPGQPGQLPARLPKRTRYRTAPRPVHPTALERITFPPDPETGAAANRPGIAVASIP
jgi:hypothetical protein